MRSLVRVIDSGSINAAARDLFITPPSLHQRLRSLEVEMGCSLLERSHRGVRATPAGARLYEACTACLAELDRARTDIEALGRRQAPRTVRIGVAWRPSLRAYYAIESLHERLPSLSVQAVKVTEKSLTDALADGDIDVFECPRLTESAGLLYHRFGTDTYRCVCGPESRWARCDSVTLGMLEDATVYAGSDYRTYHSYRACAEVQRFCARENFKATPYPTERIVADCMSCAAVVLFTANRADDLCPPLVHTALDIPPVEIGAYTRPEAADDVLAVVEALRTRGKE